MKRAPSIAVPIVVLVVATVLLATTIQFAITFSGPPPRPAPVSLDQVAEGLKQGEWPRRIDKRARVIAGTLADSSIKGSASPARDAAIAARLGTDPANVAGRYAGNSAATEAIRGEFAIMWNAPGGPRLLESIADPVVTRWHWVTMLSALATLILLSGAAWWVARRIARPLDQLARDAASSRLGDATPLRASGPREVRQLADSIERMRVRINEQAEGRTVMLAAIAHDLGTPLARLAFLVEQLPDAARDRAGADLAEMREMLGDLLRFARDNQSDRDPQRIELGSLIESVAADLAAGNRPVTAQPGERVVVTGDPRELRRLFVNLSENAVRYGGSAALSWSSDGVRCTVLVDDCGPGFGADSDALFLPFARGEGSRNRATGGIGLGLTIARAIAEHHGGEISLESHPGGGRVRVTLPLERPAARSRNAMK